MAKKAEKSSVTTPVSTSSAAAKPALAKPTVSKAKKHLKAQAAGVAAAVEGFVQAIVGPHEASEGKAEVVQPEITHETIAVRAYTLYLERRGENGSQAGDWVRAEEELRAGFVR